MGLTLSVAPTEQPVALGEVRSHSRILTTAEDSDLEAYLKAATDQAQVILRRQLCAATYVLKLDSFCDRNYSDGWMIELPLPPLVSVTSITYIDSAGATQTLATDRYIVGISTEPGRITPAVNYTWPETQSGRMESVSITYVAGYGTAAQVPWGIKVAIMQMAATWFENREAVAIGTTVATVPNAAQRLLGTFGWGSYV